MLFFSMVTASNEDGHDLMIISKPECMVRALQAADKDLLPAAMRQPRRGTNLEPTGDKSEDDPSDDELQVSDIMDIEASCSAPKTKKRKVNSKVTKAKKAGPASGKHSKQAPPLHRLCKASS